MLYGTVFLVHNIVVQYWKALYTSSICEHVRSKISLVSRSWRWPFTFCQIFASAWCVSSFSVSILFNDTDARNIFWTILLAIFSGERLFPRFGGKWSFLWPPSGQILPNWSRIPPSPRNLQATSSAWFQASPAMYMTSALLRDVTHRILAIPYRRFRTTFLLGFLDA